MTAWTFKSLRLLTPSGHAPHLRSLDSSATPLWENEISKMTKNNNRYSIPFTWSEYPQKVHLQINSTPVSQVVSHPLQPQDNVGCVLCIKRQEGGLSSEHISITLSITAPPISYFPSSSGAGRIGPVATAVPEQRPVHITPQAGRRVQKTYPTSELWLLDNRRNFLFVR